MDEVRALADFELDEGSVLIGTQGPDLFFFHRALPWMPGKPLRELGSVYHRAMPSKIFDAMRDYIETSDKKDIAKSYEYGFMLHYALDRRCHPFVYSLQEKMVAVHRGMNPSTAHNTIELAFDSYLIWDRYGDTNPAKHPTAGTINLSPEAADEIAKMMVFVTERVAGVTVTEDDIRLAIADVDYIQKATFDPYGIKRAVFIPLETLAAPALHNLKATSWLRFRDLEKAKKYVNINNGTWVSVYSGEKSNASLMDLFEEAKGEALEMLAELQDGGDAAEITGNLSFDTCEGVEENEADTELSD